MSHWAELLHGNPLAWLLEEETPAVRHLALRQLLDRPGSDPEMAEAQHAAMRADPIAAILAAQYPDGHWVKPGPGYSPKYRSTVWQVIFLDQLGADGGDERVRRACEHVLVHSQTPVGGFGASGISTEVRPAPARAIHCLNGNLLRSFLGFGWLADERVQRSIEWQARSITGEGFSAYYQSGTSGPGFACVANDKLPCAWGAIKAMLALARVPAETRTPVVQRAIDQGAEFLLSRDPAVADYPVPARESRPSGSWFRLGFPSGYVADVLQNMEALVELGYARDSRLGPALRWLLSQQDGQGRWLNRYAYNRKTWVDFEPQGRPSKWVTLRACRVLKAAFP